MQLIVDTGASSTGFRIGHQACRMSPFGPSADDVVATWQEVTLPIARGEVAEWFKAAVLKTVEAERLPGVRIPSSPPAFARLRRASAGTACGRPILSAIIA